MDERVSARFDIERLAGEGGMGAVYKARDRATGAVVALKVLREAQPERFEREAEVLARLDHPGIVRYVGHGKEPSGSAWLAMEWLEGEDLEARLARGSLTIRESVTLVLRVAGALAAAHAHGVVHRDIKPSNLFLVGGDLARPKLLDFGVAGIAFPTMRLTRTGMLLGTPGYMSPEQARGRREVDARADVFSLGCVLFECVTGLPTFSGDGAMAILAKVLVDEPPLVSDVTGGAQHPDLDALVARMLAKSPDERPADMRALRAELLAIQMAGEDGGPPLSEAKRPALSDVEQRLVSIVMFGDASEAAPTPLDEQSTMALAPLFDTIRGLGGRLEILADGTGLVVLSSHGSLADLATRAGQCALDVRDAAPTLPIAIATGRAGLQGPRIVGDTIDRAAALLRARRGQGQKPTIWLDEATGALLDTRFEQGAGILIGGRDPRARTPLDKRTPCLGRDAELAALEACLAECLDDRVARVALVVGPIGIGKSRLRREFLERASDALSGAAVWIARGDPLAAGSPFALAAQIARQATGVRKGDPANVRSACLRRGVERHLPPDKRARVEAFVAELLGVPLSDEAAVTVRSAGRDPIVLGDQVQRAWEDFMIAEIEARPVVLVLEDLQWGDKPTVRLLESVLEVSQKRPLLVVALGRPELGELFPDLFLDVAGARIRLAPLAPDTCERIVELAFGRAPPPEVTARIVKCADGNPYYVEELVRAAARGSRDELPDTILAVVEARFGALEPERRKLLRAASVFGRVFWTAGVAALLGVDLPRVRCLVDELVGEDILARRPDGRFAGGDELAFRHALVRDAAYATLTDADRELAHRLAARWLDAAGETDPVVLAEHFERGGEPGEARSRWTRAAELALEGNDFEGAIAQAARAAACGADGRALGELWALRAEARRWRGENAEAAAAAGEAMRYLDRGSDRWGAAAAELALTSMRLGRSAELVGVGDALLESLRGDRPNAGTIRAAARVGCYLLFVGNYALGGALVDAAEDGVGLASDDPATRGRIHEASAARAQQAGDVANHLALTRAAIEAFEEALDPRSACAARANHGGALLEMGAFEAAEAALRSAIETTDRLRLGGLGVVARANLAFCLRCRGQRAEAARFAREAIDGARAQGDRRIEGGARVYLAAILADGNDLEAAEAEVRAAVSLLDGVPTLQAWAHAVLAAALLDAGRSAEAVTLAREAIAVLAPRRSVQKGDALVRWVFARALDAQGDHVAARSVIGAARTRLLERASEIKDDTLRTHFLERIPENRGTLALAKAWLGG